MQGEESIYGQGNIQREITSFNQGKYIFCKGKKPDKVKEI